MKILPLILCLTLCACTSVLQVKPTAGLSKVEIQALVENEQCTGKGLTYVVAEAVDRSYAITDNTAYLSPGFWKFSYSPEMQSKSSDGQCIRSTSICLHCEFRLNLYVKKSHSYFIHLDDEKQAVVVERKNGR